jgi:hypothetical protein
MIICSASNIDLIQGSLGYGDATEGINITDWRISNTQSAIAGQSGVFNIFNSSSITPNISIVDNGTVGIGTVPSISSTSKMEIVGNVNITGAYNINNRNVINDTSNYILSTSNALVSRINAGGGGGALTSGGNLSLSNNATSNTILSIANSNVVVYSSNYTSNYSSNYTSNYTSNVVTEQYTAAATPTFSIGGPSTSDSITSSIDKFMIFTNANINNTFTVPAGGLNCDILMIGGGSSGQMGGGGAGACIVAINQTLSAGTCVVYVGGGGNSGGLGGDSYITVGGNDRYRAKGGGNSPGSQDASGNSGGCGGGAARNINLVSGDGGSAVQTNVVNGSTATIGPSITSTYAVMGNAGGGSGIVYNNAGGGGGIGTAGGTGGGDGGNGAYQVTLTGAATPINFRGYFANGSTSFGVQHGSTGNYYIGGGGGGLSGGNRTNGGLGGGGGPNYGYAGGTNTGSGGAGNNNGGTGIIIIRYRSPLTTTTTPTTITVPITTTLTTTATAQATTLGTPSIELIRGIAGDSNQDYKLGNYDGNFKIMSSISNTDTDRLALTSSGNLSLSNNSTNSTALSIINSNVVVAATPATTGGRIDTITTVGAHSQGTIGTTDRFMIFTANGSFTVPTGGIVCDILMIGGGGAGGGFGGGGGGAGACIVAINQTLSTTGLYNVAVGAGDVASSTTTGAGVDSTIGLNGGATLYIAKGGGRGEQRNYGRNQGGCGGGAGWEAVKTGGLAVNTNMVAGTLVDANARSATFAVFGNKGGDRPDTTSGVSGAGGGGIGGAGGNHIVSSINAGPGGVGLFQATVGGTTYNFRSYFANNGTPYNFGALNSADSQYYIGGGGGGSVWTNSTLVGPNTGGIGGVGGGGKGGILSRTNPDGTSLGAENGVAGIANTGSGGGGAHVSNGAGGNGGSGIVIIRYRAPPATVGVPSVELVRGIAGDSNHDYKVGNYDGNFKIMSAVSGAADTERLNITTTGNVGIGTSSPANELHIFDSTTSATSLIIQNNNMITTTNTVQGTSTATASTTVTGTSVVQYIPSFSVGGPDIHGLVSARISSSPEIWDSSDRVMIFKTTGVNHTFTVPSGGLTCSILMIGGGGGGHDGGGGAGACIVAVGQTLPAGECIVNVGTGGVYSTNGDDSFIKVDNADRYRAKGGGGGSGIQSNGKSGGCGGAGGWGNGYTNAGGEPVTTNVVNGVGNIGPSRTPNINETTVSSYQLVGYRGGNQYDATTNLSTKACPGGGGIGEPGINHASGDNNATAGGGGIGHMSLYYHYYFADYFHLYYDSSFNELRNGNYINIGGGGGGALKEGGGTNSNNNLGGVGGGGRGAFNTNNNWTSGKANTGSGGGGAGGLGGSGLVVIRYKYRTVTTTTTTTTTTYTHTPTITTTLSTPTLGTPSIELVRGTQGDSNRDYKIGNYEGDFIVKSSVSNTDSDYLRLSGANGNTFNFTNSLNWNQTSDRRIKENIMRASYDMCYNNIDKLELNRFNYIKEFNTGNKDINQLGFIAQEIKEIFPKAVFTNNYNSVDLSIPDMLSIDIGQINFTLYGAVKKLMEINKDKELRLKRLECLLNVESGSGDGSDGSGDNVVIDSDVSIDTSNLLETSNIVIDTSNITIDTSNLLETSNITIDTSNITIDTSNITIDTSNIILDTSNIVIDTINIVIDTSNIILDTSNISIDTSNISIDTSNISIDTSNI